MSKPYSFSGIENYAEVVRVVFDKNEPPERRLSAILDLDVYDDASIQRCLQIAADPTEPSLLRGEVCDRFGSEWGEQALPILRAGLRDPSVEVRFWMAFALAENRNIPIRQQMQCLSALDEMMLHPTMLEGWWYDGREAVRALERIHYTRLAHTSWSTTWVISPWIEYKTPAPLHTPAPYTLDIEWLKIELRRRWKTIRFTRRVPLVRSYALEWQVGRQRQLVLGALQQDGCSIVLTAHRSFWVHKFAVWLRSILPTTAPLYLTEWADRPLLLEKGITLQQLTARMKSLVDMAQAVPAELAPPSEPTDEP